MNEWSLRRKRTIFFVVLSLLIVLLGFPTFFLFYRSPTCSDNKQNGTEAGVDCGGACQRICSAQSLPLLLKGDPRVLSPTLGVYEVVAVVQNPNVTAEVKRARYSLKLFEGSATIPLTVIEGETFVPKNSTFAIFEGPMNLGDAKPDRATLEWKSGLDWQKDGGPIPDLVTRNILLSKEDSEPRVDALLVNNSLEKVTNVELVALLSDESGNIIASSKTFVEEIPGSGLTPVVFTWPKPFGTAVSSVDIITRVFPDRSYIR
jgi:hypothetical protein